MGEEQVVGSWTRTVRRDWRLLTVVALLVGLSMSAWVQGGPFGDRFAVAATPQVPEAWLVTEVVFLAGSLVRWRSRWSGPALVVLGLLFLRDVGLVTGVTTVALTAGWFSVAGVVGSHWSIAGPRRWQSVVALTSVVVASLLVIGSWSRDGTPVVVAVCVLAGGFAIAEVVGRRVDRSDRPLVTWSWLDPPAASAPVDPPPADPVAPGPGEAVEELGPDRAGPDDRPSPLAPLVAWAAASAASLLCMRVLLGESVRGWGDTAESFVRMDGLSYLRIARNGVELGEWPTATIDKMPGYPLLVRLVHGVVDDWNAAAAIVTFVAAAVLLVLFYRWMALLGMSERARRFGLAIVCTYPYGFFLFGFAYSEASFLALVMACFVLVAKDRPLPAAAFAAAACIVRPSGVVVVVAFAVVAVHRSWLRWGRPGTDASGGEALDRRWLAAPFVAASGLVGYAVYCWWRWGDPFVYVAGQGAIAAHPEVDRLRVWLLSSFASGLFLPGSSVLVRLNSLIEAVLVVAAIAVAPRVVRRFGLVYAAYLVSVAVLILATSDNFSSAGRYLLPAFPLTALVASWMARHPKAGVALISAMAVAWVVLYQQFISGYPYAL